MTDDSRTFDAAAALEETLAALEGREPADIPPSAEEPAASGEPEPAESDDAGDADTNDTPFAPDEPDDAAPFDDDEEEGRKVFAGFARKDDEDEDEDEEEPLPSDDEEWQEDEDGDGEDEDADEVFPAAFTVTSEDGLGADGAADEIVDEIVEEPTVGPAEEVPAPDDVWDEPETCDEPDGDVPQDEAPSDIPNDAAPPAPMNVTYTGQEAMGLSMILVASIITAFALLFSAIFYKAPVQTVPPDNGEDLTFVSDSDTVDIDDLTGSVIGVGVLYDSAKVYDAADGNVLGEFPADTTLMIYASDHGYYRVTDIDNTLTGYVKKDEVNTGGIDVGNPDAPEQFIDDTTGDIFDVTEPTDSGDATEPAEPTSSTQPETSDTTADEPTVTTASTVTTVKTTTSKTTTTKKSTTAKKTSATSKTTAKTSSTTRKTTTTTKSSDAVKPENFPVNASPYFIYVEKGSHTITIYAKDSNGKYTTAVRTYLTATGRTSSLTPVGLFSVGGKEKWHSWGGKSYSPYAARYYNGLFFHGPLYRQKNFGTLIESSVSAIGTNASSGCMRTSAQAAYFIYAFCPSGTYVKIVNGSPLGRGAGRPSVNSQYVDPATNKVPVAGVSLKPEARTVKMGESFTVKATISPDNATEKACYWISGNPKVATVKGSGTSCTVTAKAAGKAVITVTTVDGSYKATLTVTVTEPTTTTTTASTTSTTKASETTTSTTQSTTKATETSKSTTKSTTKATETTTSTTSTTSTTKATETTKSTTKSTTKATETTKSTTKSTTKATETTKSTTKSTTKATETTKSTTKSTTKATETAKPTTKSTTKATETTKSTTKSTTKATTKSTTKATESHVSSET